MVAALSDYVARQFAQHYGLDDGRMTVIPNGVKTDKPVDTERALKLRTQMLDKLGLEEADRPVFFLFVANNFRLKGLAPLIEALSQAAVQPTDRPAYLVVAGSDRTQKYRRLARQVGIEKRIIFLGPVRNIQNILSIVDVAVLPTFYDPSSRFTLEALAGGRPVITTRFNGAAELFVNNRHGITIDRPEDVTALARALFHFTDAANILRAAEAIHQDNLKANISISRVAEQMVSLYTSIAEGGK
jgi:UDP-glucose:(heptosyl)LPS alpha-1,3-glucosyltransferase